jgi:hypothetical protein
MKRETTHIKVTMKEIAIIKGALSNYAQFNDERWRATFNEVYKKVQKAEKHLRRTMQTNMRLNNMRDTLNEYNDYTKNY